MRAAAGQDPARAREAFDEWPLRDLFLFYEERLRDQALERYRAELLVWAALAPYQKQSQEPPQIPSILK